MERREAVITGIVLAVTCALIAAITAIARDSVADLAINPADDAVETATPTPVASELDQFVAEAIEFVEAVRGRSFITVPDVVVLTDDEFVARIMSDFESDVDEDPEGFAAATATHRALGTIGRLESFDEVLQRFGAAGILGFYDPESDELVVRQADELSLLTKSTIVHELAHAFDDQHFDLDRPEYEERTDEVAWTFRAVAEGSALWVEDQWEAMLSVEDQQAIQVEELGFADPGIFDQFELSFLFLQFAVYDIGGEFVTDQVSAGGNAALDALIETPPATSEQLIDPAAFREEEAAITVPVPEVDGEVLIDGIGGQVLMQSLFEGAGIRSDIEWGGDWLVIWDDNGLSCLRWDIQADSSAGLADLEVRFEQWTQVVGSATVRTLDDETIRVDRCV